MKKRILAISLAVLLVAVAGYGTLAYFTATDDAKNVITTGTLDIVINEYQVADPIKAPDGTQKKVTEDEGDDRITIKVGNAIPGDIISKIPKVENIESINAWVRVKVTVECVDADGTTLSTAPIAIDYNIGDEATQWTLGSYNYYYYNSIVAPKGTDGSETAQLFSTVTLNPTTTDNTYQGAKVTITLEAQAVQSGNNGATALGADGWPSFS